MKTRLNKRILCATLVFLSFLLGFYVENKDFTYIETWKTAFHSTIKRNKTFIALWKNDFKHVKIKSKLDGKMQNAFFYKTKSTVAAPLLISLHTWSGDFGQFDSLALLCKSKDINYIHPDFRGPNSSAEACGSALALSDIDDAISYAIQSSNVDTTKIFLVGASGGGHATLSSFMKSKHHISKYSAWASITDLVSWYNESLIRNAKFSHDIMECTGSNNGRLQKGIAEKKSPIYWNTPKHKLKNSNLYIYAGIYDGIKGGVPITHSINFYNKLLRDFGVTDSIYYVTNKEKLLLLEHREALGRYKKISNRNVFLLKKFKNIKLVIYEGNHEILTEYAFNELLGF